MSGSSKVMTPSQARDFRDDVAREISRKMREIRFESGFRSQEDFSRAVGLSPSQVQRIEVGGRISLSTFLGVAISVGIHEVVPEKWSDFIPSEMSNVILEQDDGIN